MGAQKSLQDPVFKSFGCTPRSGTVGSWLALFKPLLCAYCVPETGLRTWHIFTHSVPSSTLYWRSNYPQFAAEKIKAQRVEVICAKSLSQEAVEQGVEPWPAAQVLDHHVVLPPSGLSFFTRLSHFLPHCVASLSNSCSHCHSLPALCCVHSLQKACLLLWKFWATCIKVLWLLGSFCELQAYRGRPVICFLIIILWIYSCLSSSSWQNLIPLSYGFWIHRCDFEEMQRCPVGQTRLFKPLCCH